MRGIGRLRVAAIVPAAGLSRRMRGFKKRKPFVLLANKAIVSYALDVFKKISAVKEIILVVNKKDLNLAKRSFQAGIIKVIGGGLQRKDSVYSGIKAIKKDSDIIIIHDGVRPFVTKRIILNSIYAAKKFGCSVVAVPVIPTIKVVDRKGFVATTLQRSQLREIQTPQAFKRDIITKAYEDCRGMARRAPAGITDDAMLVESLGYKVKAVMGSYENIKITTPQDLKIAEAILKRHAIAKSSPHTSF